MLANQWKASAWDLNVGQVPWDLCQCCNIASSDIRRCRGGCLKSAGLGQRGFCFILPLWRERDIQSMQIHSTWSSDLCSSPKCFVGNNTQKLTQRHRNLRNVFWSLGCLGLALLQASGFWSPWYIICTWKNGPGLQNHLSTDKWRQRGVLVFLCIVYARPLASAFRRQVFKFKVSARSHLRHWIRRIRYQRLGLQKVNESWVFPFGCCLFPAETWMWNTYFEGL